MPAPLPWRAAWQQALYGPGGFYRGYAGPAAHFTTATHGATGAVLARALWAWADRLGCDGIVDVGAGRGELLAHLRAVEPTSPLTGVDVVERPDALPRTVGWLTAPGGSELPDELAPRGALVVAHEWLDVVPCTVAEADGAGTLREVLVDPVSGVESLGEALDDVDRAWCERFWPTTELVRAAGGRKSVHPRARTGREGGGVPVEGRRVEVGRARDEAWAALLDRLDGGAAVAVDYGHTLGERPVGGSLTAYREGRVVDPVPDGSCDLTAHVAVDSLLHDRLLRQTTALDEVGIRGRRPDHALATQDPAAYLAGLAESSAVAALRQAGGFGDFWWVVAGRTRIDS